MEHAAQVWIEAERVIGSIQDNYERSGALSALGKALAQAQQSEHASQAWAEAERVIGSIQDSAAQARALRDLAIMSYADELELALHLIQRSWRQVETREDALALFSMASAVISSKPNVGIPFFEAFIWVDTFLGG